MVGFLWPLRPDPIPLSITVMRPESFEISQLAYLLRYHVEGIVFPGYMIEQSGLGSCYSQAEFLAALSSCS